MESPDLQMQMIEVEAQTIVVREDLPRVRTDLGEVKKLAESFAKYGQLQPIVVNRNMELIAGGRRLAACLLSGRKAKIAFNDTVDPLMMREMELEENLQRKSLTPAEELLAIDEIHRLKQTLHGESCSGKPGVGWSMDDTAELIGKTPSSISKDLQLAEMLKQFPSLAECKTKNEISKAAKGLQKIAGRMAALQNLETLTLTNNLYNVYQADALEDMKTIPDKSVDLLLTDPLYGISIDEVAMSIGHKSGGLPTTGFNYKDSKEDALLHYSVLAKESFRFCTESSHAFVFTSPTNFCVLRDLFREAGWLCSDRPIIWIKNETGQNNNPDKWFSSTYEILLFARRQSSRLVVEAKGDWIQTPPVWGEQKMHQAQKPLVLLKELIQRTTLPGQSLYDPFMGSGSSIIAALDLKIFARGCDIAEESFATTMYRIREWETMQKVK